MHNMKTTMVQKIHRVIWAIGLVGLLVASTQAQQAGNAIQVNVGESVILPVEHVGKLAIADPAVADVAPLTEKEISVIGRKVGTTVLTVVYTNGAPSVLHRIEVGNETMMAVIRKAIAPATISVRMLSETLVLEGQVETELESQRAEQIAKAFKPQVANLLEIKAPRQIKIRVRVAEVSSDAVRKIGFKWLGGEGAMRYAFDLNPIDKLFDRTTHGFVGTDPNGTWGAIGSSWSADGLLQLLEQKGLAKLLSEPTLITRSGSEASFLAGEEVPIVQTLQNSSSVTFKEVGVRMVIKPVADSQNRINTTIQAEASALKDRTVTKVGETLPVITTRKASSTLQLNDGQTIVIGGLLDNNISPETLRKFPWLGDIPVIGALFRHHDKGQSQRELVFFMTTSVVKDAATEVQQAPRTPQLQDWQKKATDGVLEVPNPKEDWGLHHPNGWGLPDPPKTEPVIVEPVKEPMKNFTPARPAAK
jgi:pilus assembly protein CpaC